MIASAYSVASKFKGVKEIAGVLDNPVIMEWLRLDNKWPEHDETPWCSAFVNWICWLLNLPRTKSLMARSWLGIGEHISIGNAWQGNDVVILSRGDNPPGPHIYNAPGHVGFYGFHHSGSIWVLGGNQGDSVSIEPFPMSRILGIRRLE